jgi:hypothetical protein
MPIKLNLEAFEHAKELINKKHVVLDDNVDVWKEHRPSDEKEDEFIRQHGLTAYADWYLGIDDAEHANPKGKYKFLYGDFKNIHYCGVLNVKSRAEEYKYYDIEVAAGHLQRLLDDNEKPT